MAILFRATKRLENQIDAYLDAISQANIVFTEGVKNYLDSDTEKFNDRLIHIDDLESKADRLRRDIENDLYQHSLIPEHRGDVLGLLETVDELIDLTKETLNQFSVEHPFIPGELNARFNELVSLSCHAAEEVVLASRAFFKNVTAVKNHLHKVYFYEKEADKTGDALKRSIFQHTDLDLSQKMHLRYFTNQIDHLADAAEGVADRLSIYTIKRTI